MDKRTFSLKKNIMAEALALFFNIFIPGVVWTLTFLIGTMLVSNKFYFLLILSPLIAASIYIALVGLIRFFLPKLRPGSYDLKKDPMVIIWYLHMSLNRSLKSTGLLSIVRSSNLLRFLHLKALGSKVAYSANFSAELELVDPSLIQIDKNVIVGGRCYMGCHVVFDGKLILGKIHLKEGCFISLGNVIGQGTVVGKKATIGAGNYLYRDQIPDRYKLPNFAWSEGSPKQRQNAKKKMDENLKKTEFLHFNQMSGMMRNDNAQRLQ